MAPTEASEVACTTRTLLILLIATAASVPAKETEMTVTQAEQAPGRVVIGGVKPMTWADGEMCEFVSALTRTLACVGETVPNHYLLGLTGVAFRFTFGPELWNPGFYGFSAVSADVHDLIRRAFEAVGYEYHWQAAGGPGASDSAMVGMHRSPIRSAIRWS